MVTKKRTPQQQGRRSRRKGATWERQVAKELRHIYPDAKRGLAQSRFGRGEAPDVDMCPPFWIETKHEHVVAVRKASRQASEAMAAAQRDGDRWPIAVCKDDPPSPGQPSNRFVVMQWDDFKELIEEWASNRSGETSKPPTSSVMPVDATASPVTAMTRSQEPEPQ